MQTVSRPSTSCDGFSLIEAMVAVAIVGIACSAVLLSASQAMQASHASLGTNRANMLALDLMTEISACRWAESDEPLHWGPEDDERTLNCRAAFDDLDDYDGWSGAPQTRDGRLYDAIQQELFPSVRSREYAPFTYAVRVAYVSSAGQPMPAGQPSLFRQVTVEVTHPKHAPQSLSRIFGDPAPLLGRTYWFDPAHSEPIANVVYVP